MARRLPGRRLPLLLQPLLQPLLLLTLAAAARASTTDHPDRGLLGAPCRASGRCDVPNARCVDATCTCPEQLVASTSRRRCLTVSERLGMPCDEEAQCRVEHSTCRRRSRVCECKRGRVAAGGDRCLPEASLGGACEFPAQCVGLTECSAPAPSADAPGTCVCKGIAFQLDGRCVTDDDPTHDWGPQPTTGGARAAPRDGATSLLFGILANFVLTFALLQIR